jgi:hypothetical protein
MANSNNQLKAYVRFDGTGRIVPSSLILQRFKPKDGNWQEIDAKECCNFVPTTTTTTTATPTTTTTTTVAPTTTTTTTVALPANCIEFVANTESGGTTFYMDVYVSADITYTVTWGDGTTSTGSTSEGVASLEHEYPLEVTAAYTVRLCFSDASLVTELEFYGND